MWRKRANKRVDLKGFRRQHGLRALSFASTEELFSIMELTPGAVTPLGILNDTESRVHFYLDEEFIEIKLVFIQTTIQQTIWMQADDLMGLIQKHGNEAEYVKI